MFERFTRRARQVVVGRGTGTPPDQMIPFTKGAQRALELSLREALSLGDREIRTEHVLLALVRVGGPAVEILREFDLEPEQVRRAVLRASGGESEDQISVSLAADYEEVRGRPVHPLLLGWLLFAVALGIGLLLGWLIWA